MIKRRSKGDGTLRKRADGRWEGRVSVGFNDNGTPKHKYFYGASQKEVKEKIKLFQRDIDDGLSMDDVRFDAWALNWYEDYKGEVSDSTYSGYKYTLKDLIARFGEENIRNIKPMHVETYLKDIKKQGRSDSYIAKHRGMLFQIMERAEANDLIRKNPVRYAKKKRQDTEAKEKEAYSEEEIILLFRYLPYDKLGLSIRLMLGTGIRGQELLALGPEHIEPDGSEIRIRQAVKLVDGRISLGPPKSKESVRDVPVPKELRSYVSALRGMGGENYIWQSQKTGNPIYPDRFRDKFKAAVEAVPGVRVLNPHCLRHTYVTQLQAQGVDLSTIQSLVGHADVKMTKHYLHVRDEVKLRAVEKLDTLFAVS